MLPSVQTLASNPTRRSVLFTTLSFLLCGSRSRAFGSEDDPMKEFGKLNSNAPAALSRFAFLVGNWKGHAKIKSASGDWQTFDVTWRGRFILDGYVIADENFRSYDAAMQTWNIRWLNALTGAWTDLVSPEFGGVSFNGSSVSYAFKEPTAVHPYTRATYTSVSPSHFTWKGDQSADGKMWSDFMIVDVDRIAQ
jgi:hypothetical protein